VSLSTLTIIAKPVTLEDRLELSMRKYWVLVFGIALMSFAPVAAEAKCSAKMPTADWRPKKGRASSFSQYKGDMNFECTTEKCGGPKNYVLLRQGALEIKVNGKKIPGPLKLDGLEGNKFSDFYSVGELYLGDKRFISLIVSGVKSSFRRKNLEVLKASIRCQ
jgi:hypothetical protein